MRSDATADEWALQPRSFFLLGRFRFRAAGHSLADSEKPKIQELLGYLLLFRDRMHHREALADVLWSAASPNMSRKYLRQALWRLQSLVGRPTAGEPLLLVETNWVSVNPEAQIWLDLDEFEQAARRVHGVRGGDLSPSAASELRRVADLYCGDLLEGWYQDWCVYERERLKARYLAMLEKLFEYAESHRQLDDAIAFGERILRHDRAHERTHVRMMRLHLLADDRTSALRQFRQCVDVLDKELGVRPASRTVALYEQIRADAIAESLQGAPD